MNRSRKDLHIYHHKRRGWGCGTWFWIILVVGLLALIGQMNQ